MRLKLQQEIAHSGLLPLVKVSRQNTAFYDFGNGLHVVAKGYDFIVALNACNGGCNRHVQPCPKNHNEPPSRLRRYACQSRCKSSVSLWFKPMPKKPTEQNHQTNYAYYDSGPNSVVHAAYKGGHNRCEAAHN